LRDDLGVRLEQQAAFSEASRNRVREGFSATVDTVTNDGGALMAVPLHVSAPTVAYRTDLFERGGYPRDSSRATTPMTWQTFADAVNDVQNQTGVSVGFGFGAERYDGLACCLFNEVLNSWGGAYFGRPDRLLDPSRGRPVTAGNRPARQAMAMFRTFIYEDDRQALDDYASEISSPDVLDWRDEDPIAGMVRGNVASMRARTADLATLAESSVGSSIGAMPLPYAVTESEADQRGAGGSSPSMGGWNVVVNPRSRNVDAAARAAAAMTTDEFRLAMLEQADFVPPRASLFGTSRARQSTMGPLLPAVRFAAENAIPRPSNRRWYERMSDVVERELHACLAQEQNPVEAASSIESRLRAFEG
jgi:ABC-type glycerol-3-phosphate transport system substrate-binding protein